MCRGCPEPDESSLGGFKIKKNTQKKQVLFRKEQPKNKKKNSFLKEGVSKSRRKDQKISKYFGFCYLEIGLDLWA